MRCRRPHAVVTVQQPGRSMNTPITSSGTAFRTSILLITMLLLIDPACLQAQTQTRTVPNALLAIDQNRTSVINRVVAKWGSPLAQSDAGVDAAQLRTMLAGLRADHLL